MSSNHDDSPVRIGDILAGKYRVERILGAGAMGVVVAAMHVELEERRAIKFMLPAMLGDAPGVERFLREARAAVRLKSQHVAKVQDVGRLETGAPYIVMEYLEGGDLKSVLASRGALPADEAVRYLLQVCEALGEAHGLGIVHRDLKPANLFVTRGVNGQPCLKVLDFGIAKVVGGDEGAMEMTKTSELLGTPLYMSPEQMRSTRSVDARSDLWSVGVILYRMLTGKVPFAGATVTEICSAVIADEPEPPSTVRADLPPGLEAVVLKCLEKSPAKRFASAGELAAALAPFATAMAPRASSSVANLGSTVVMEPASPTNSPPLPPPPGASTGNSAMLIGVSTAVGAASAVGDRPSVSTPLPQPPGHATAGGASWTHSGRPAPPRKKPVALIAAVVVAALGAVGLAVFLGEKQSGEHAAPAITAAPEQATAAATGPSPPAPVATATGTPTATASAAAASASPAPVASAPVAASPPPTFGGPRPVRPKGPKSDAFGDDRK